MSAASSSHATPSLDRALAHFTTSLVELGEELYSFATGSYLTAEEKEFWDPLFPVEAAEEFQQLSDTFSKQLRQAADLGHNFPQLALSFLQGLADLNQRYEFALLEGDDLEGVLSQLAILATHIPHPSWQLPELKDPAALETFTSHPQAQSPELAAQFAAWLPAAVEELESASGC